MVVQEVHSHTETTTYFVAESLSPFTGIMRGDGEQKGPSAHCFHVHEVSILVSKESL